MMTIEEKRERARVRKQRQRSNPEGLRKSQITNWKVQGIIGCTPELVQALLVAQNYQCSICHDPIDWKTLNVDHDHSIDDRFNVRGLLCRTCNTTLGWIELGREREFFKKAPTYIDYWKQQNAPERDR